MPRKKKKPTAERGSSSGKGTGGKILDALAANICVLDNAGKILAVNQAWREFATANSNSFSKRLETGANYYEICRAVTGRDRKQAMKVLAGLLAVASGRKAEFSLEYPCHSPNDFRWFELKATRVPRKGPARVVVVHRDISKRKLTDEALFRSEERLQLVLNASNDGLWDWDVKRGVAYLSPNYYELTGYHPSEAVPDLQFYQKLVHPEDWPHVLENIRANLEGKTRETLHEYRMIRKDGTQRWVMSRGRVVERAKDGSPLRMVGAISDITQRKKAEFALKEKEELYHRLFQAESDAIFLINCDNQQFLDANVAAERLYGYTREEFLRLKATDISAEPEKTRQAILANEPHVGLRWHRRKDGTTFPVEITGGSMELRGQQIYIGTVRDITERVKAEAEVARELSAMALLTEVGGQLPQGNTLSAVLDKIIDTAITLAQSDMASLQLYEPESRRLKLRTVRGFQQDWIKYWSDVGEGEGLCGAALQRRERMVAEDILTSRHFVGSVVQKVQRLAGVRAAVSIPMTSAKNRLIGIISVHFKNPHRPEERVLRRLDLLASLAADVIELSQTESALRASTARLENVREEERARIAREVHDELGHAMTELKLDLAWLSRRLGESGLTGRTPIQKRLTAMSSAVDSHAQTIRRIATELRPAILDALGLSATLEWQVREFHQRTKIRCALRFSKNLPVLARRTAITLFRMLQEILSNIAAHSHATRAAIHLIRQADTLVVKVQDNGRGITRAQQSAPLALGLLGLRERAASLGGAITIAGLRNRGTTVTIKVPLAEACA